MINYILLYLVSVYLLYFLIFSKLFFPIKNKIVFILQNEGELRWGWGLITMSIEVYFFLGIPYRVYKHGFKEMSSYSEIFFDPFNKRLADKMIFRDVNYSIFQDENKERMIRYYQHIFPKKSIPNRWILINYASIERLFSIIPSFRIKGLLINKNSLFRSISHLVGDNPEGGIDRRKDAIFFLIPKVSLTLLIPFFPHIFLINLFISLLKKDLIVISQSSKKIKNPYIALVENNIIGRKGNRYMENTISYDFLVEKYDNDIIIWSWVIRVYRKLFAEESFPLTWKYSCLFSFESSEHFKRIWDEKYVFQQMNPNESTIYELPFSFILPKKWVISILKQVWLLNTNLMVNFQTKMFSLLPKTNLSIKKDHIHMLHRHFSSDYIFKYDIIPDFSPIRLIHRAIIRPWVIQITFQKSIKSDIEAFSFSFLWNSISINKMIKEDEGKTLIFLYKESKIPYYSRNERIDVLYCEVSNLKDETWIIHYSQDSRKIWFPWSEQYKYQ